MFDSRRDPCAQEKIFIVLQLRIGVDLFKLKLEIKLYFLSDILHFRNTKLELMLVLNIVTQTKTILSIGYSSF